MCRASKNTAHYVDNHSSDESSSEECFRVTNNKGKQWFSKVNMSHLGYSRDIICQLDSGATCNVMGYLQYARLVENGDPPITPTKIKLELYGDGAYLQPVGTVYIDCTVRDRTEKLKFYITDTTQTTLLSAESCEILGLLSVNVVHHVDVSDTNESVPLTKADILCDYGDVFEGLGNLPGEYDIELYPSVTPVQHLPRRVPQAMKEDIRVKLDELTKRGIVTKVSGSTDWINSMVAVKKGTKLRVCIDPKELNQAMKRPHYPMPVLDDILPKLADAKLFTVLDLKEGFWHVNLSEKSSYHTTFWTPFGRYRWLRVPFGISSAPEELQRSQHEAIEGLQGTESLIDDILVYGKGQTIDEAIADHDRNLKALLDRARQMGLKLNKDKLKLRQSEVKYMGQILTPNGIRPDPEKVKAINDMPRPTNAKAVQRFIGMATYLSKYLPHLSETCEPLRRLTDKDAVWSWQSQQEDAFQNVKLLVSTQPLLKYYDLNEEVTIQCDVSEVCLGATSMQNGLPITYASRALSQCEQRYAQIEKECLTIVYAFEIFDQYIFGRDILTVQSDHKPLEVIFKKSLLNAPKRLQRMLLRIQRYNLKVVYTKGSELYIADTLSRASLPSSDHAQQPHNEYIFSIGCDIAANYESEWIPNISRQRLTQIQNLTNNDETLQTLKTTILIGWPETREQVPVAIRPYWNARDGLTVQDGIIYCSNSVVIPKQLRPEILTRIHSSDLGIEACLRKARDSLYWPNMNDEIKDYISQFSTCSEMQRNQQKEPLIPIPHEIPDRPWSKVGVDLFTYRSHEVLVAVDYFSDYLEIDLLPDTTASTVINCLQQHFSRHGIPDVVISDNGPQFRSAEFNAFATEWEFEHLTSSAYHSQSNGKAESAVKIAKTMLKKAKRSGRNIWKSLLDWRNTPTVSMGSSPVQRLMSRRTRHSLPLSKPLLKPHVIENVPQMLKDKRAKSKTQYDENAKELPNLISGQSIRMKPSPSDYSKKWRYGTCVSELGTRSYVVDVDGKQYRRNRRVWLATLLRINYFNCS